MSKLTIEDLQRIKGQVPTKSTALRQGRHPGASITLQCPRIAAGARRARTTARRRHAQADRQDIRVVTSGCMARAAASPT